MGLRSSTNVRSPRPKPSAMSRAMGIAQAGMSVLAAPASGGSSLIGLPSSLKQASGSGQGVETLQGKQKGIQAPQANNAGINSLNKAGSLVNMAESASNFVNKATEAPSYNKENMADFAEPNKAKSMLESLNKSPTREQDINTISLFANAENQLNELRKTNPDLAKEIAPVFFKSAEEMVKRIREGRSILGESYGTSFNA